MKNYRDRLGFLTALTLMLVSTNAHAAERQITDVKLESNNHQLELKLSATESDGAASFYTVRDGNTIEANLLDTNLDLSQGDSFKQLDPILGVTAVEINRVDNQHTQVVVSTAPDMAIEHLLEQRGDDLVLSLNRVTKAQSFQREVEQFGKKTAKKIEQTYKTALGQKRTKDDKKSVSSKDTSNDVLIPNPEIVIDDNRVNEIKERVFKAQDSELGDNPVPATLPRAVAPPVGDMAVSNVSTMPDMVDMGSAAIVPRLVLRDAPIREVLSLLARSANLNVVYAGNNDEVAFEGEETGPTISLDLENQPVQEVFNSVLLVSGLDANRRGNIIYVGEQLPAQARNLVSRTVRLNQVSAENAALYLASLGATGKRLTNQVEEIVDPETGRVVQRNETTPELIDLDFSEDETGTQALLLRGLQVSTDGRLNSITLVGEPRKVETGTTFLTQLDARRRQVAVNVKVLDVNLLNQDVFNSSFSFGVNDSFFVQDNGSASLRFGETAPPNTAEVTSPTGRLSNPPIVNNPFAGGETFLDFSQDIAIPGTSSGVIDNRFNPPTITQPGVGIFPGREAAISSDPFTAGVSEFSRATFDTFDADDDGQVSFSQGQDGTATSALPSFFQFPDKFLAMLEARVTSGNAKILTDPTLMVQEGQQATVKLAQNIIESVRTDIDGETGARTITPVIGEAGVVLTVNVEQIDDNGFVSMSVSPTVSSIGATQNFDSGGGAVNLLNLLSVRELSSGLVRLRDGQTLILSGIIQDQERTTISKVPILGDIPLLGALFRSTDKASERAEVIVLLTPEIVEEDAGLANNFMPGKESREMLQRQGVDAIGN